MKIANLTEDMKKSFHATVFAQVEKSKTVFSGTSQEPEMKTEVVCKQSDKPMTFFLSTEERNVIQQNTLDEQEKYFINVSGYTSVEEKLYELDIDIYFRSNSQQLARLAFDKVFQQAAEEARKDFLNGISLSATLECLTGLGVWKKDCVIPKAAIYKTA